MPSFGFGPASSGTAVGIAATRYYSLLADQLMVYDGGLSVSALATGPDAARYLILDGLRDDEAARDAWAGGYLYAHTSTTSGTQLKILSAGAHGRYGAVAVANPPASPISIGTPVSLTSLLPMRRYAAIRGVADLVDDALRSCRVLARISITSDGTRSASLAAFPFVRSEDDIRALYDSGFYGPVEPLSQTVSGWRVDVDGAGATLVTDVAYPSGQVYAAEVMVRGDQLVYDGSGWLYPTTPGLLADNYQAVAPEHWVLAFGMVKGLEQLRKLVRADRNLDRAERQARIQELDRESKLWAARAVRIALNEFPQPLAKPNDGMVGRPYLSAPQPVTTWP